MTYSVYALIIVGGVFTFIMGVFACYAMLSWKLSLLRGRFEKLETLYFEANRFRKGVIRQRENALRKARAINEARRLAKELGNVTKIGRAA